MATAVSLSAKRFNTLYRWANFTLFYVSPPCKFPRCNKTCFKFGFFRSSFFLLNNE